MPTASVSCLIIGGGIAGISAARCLLGAGFDDVKILEATERIGGRIKTVDIGELVKEVSMKRISDKKYNHCCVSC